MGNLPIGNLSPGGILRYTRRIYVGDRNDVASSANDMIADLAARQGFATGTISGDVSGSDSANVAASIIATRTGGPALTSFGNATRHARFAPTPPAHSAASCCRSAPTISRCARSSAIR